MKNNDLQILVAIKTKIDNAIKKKKKEAEISLDQNNQDDVYVRLLGMMAGLEIAIAIVKKVESEATTI